MLRHAANAVLVLTTMFFVPQVVAGELSDAFGAMARGDYTEAIGNLDRLRGGRGQVAVQALLAKGRALFLAGKYAQAEKAYRQAAKKAKEQSHLSLKASFGRAECLAAMRHFDRAERLFSKALTGITSSQRRERIARRFILLADEHLEPSEEQGPPMPARAEQFYRTALEVGIEGSLAEKTEIKIGRCLSEQNRHREAAQYLDGFQEHHEDSPRLAEALFQAAKSYFDAKYSPAARGVLRDLLAKFPYSAYAPRAVLLLAKTHGMPSPSSGVDLARGSRALAEFIEKYPGHKKFQQARLDLALAPLNAGRHAQAIDSLRKYVQTPGPDDNLASARYHLGVCLAAQERFEQAAEAWQTYLAKHPAHGFWLQARQGIEDMAYKRAEAAWQREDWVQAAKLYSQFTEKYPAAGRTPDAMLRAALAMAKVEKVAEALALLNTLCSKFPNHPAAASGWFETGRMLEEKRNRFAEARKAYEKAIGLGHSEASARLEALDLPSLVVESPPNFNTGEKPVLTWHARNIEKVEIRLYRIEAEDFFLDSLEMERVTDVDIALCSPDRTWQVPVKNFEKHKRITQDIPLKIKRPGLYLVHLSAGDLEATTAVRISDLGLIIKSEAGGVFAFSQDVRRARPMAGTRLLIADGEKLLSTRKTGSDGILQTRLDLGQSSGDIRVLAIRGDHLAWTHLNHPLSQPATAGQPRAFVFPGRPAYRPGDEVELAGIVRDRVRGGNLPGYRAGSRLPLYVNTPTGHRLHYATVELDEFGTFHHRFKLDPAVRPGRYAFSVKGHKGTAFSGSFQVEHYRLRPFEIIVTFDRAVVFRPEPLSGHIQVRHRSGTVAAHERVVYRLGENEPWDGSITDENGRVKFSLSTRGEEATQTITMEVKLFSHNLLQKATALVAVQEYEIGLELPHTIIFAGQPFDLTVSTTGPDGKPFAASLELEALHRLPQSGGEVRAFARRVKVGKDGLVRVPVTLEKKGTHILRAIGIDRAGHPVTAEVGVNVVGKEEPGIFLDMKRTRQTLGTPAELVIHSRLERALVLMTYETDRVIGYRTVKVTRGNNELALPMTEKLVPNFVLSAATMEGDDFYTVSRQVVVTRQLKLTVRADRKSYQPGDEVTLTLIARDADLRPVDARLIVNVVDEALFRIFPENLPELLSSFHWQRPMGNIVTISSNTYRFPEVEAVESEQAEVLETEGSAAMAALRVRRREMTEEAADQFAEMADMEGLHGGGVGSGAGYGGLGMRGVGRGGGGRASIRTGRTRIVGGAPPRQFFSQTAVFLPEVRTGADGVASVSFRLPDSITTWRVTTRGVTRDTQLGEDRTKLVAVRDFWVELLAPAELEQGDRLRPGVRVFNNLPQAKQASVVMNFMGKETRREVKVGARRSAEVYFDEVLVPDNKATDSVEMRLVATAGEHKDELLRSLPVRPRGIREEFMASGRLDRVATRTITLPKDLEDPQLTIVLDARMSHIFLAGRLDPVLFGDRPEESLVALNVLELLGKESAPVMRDMLRARLSRALVHLTLVECPGGGWGWGRGNCSASLVITARAVRALARSRPLAGGLGWSFPQVQYDRALDVLKKGLSSLPADDFMRRTEILYALAHHGRDQVPQMHLHRMHRLREKLPLGAQALLGLTWKLLDRKEKALEVAKLARQKISLQTPLARRFSWLPIWGNEPADVARALEMLAAVKPSDPLVKQGSEWLLSVGEAVGWGFPRESEAVSAALCELLAAPRKGERFRAKVSVNGTLVKTVSFPSPEGQAMRRLEVDPGVLKSGDNKLRIEIEGKGACFFTANLSAFRRGPGPEPKGKQRVELSRHLEPLPEPYRGQKIRTGFSVVASGSPTWMNEVTRLAAGRKIRVTLVVKRNFGQRLDHCVLTDRIPPGFELVSESASGSFFHMRQQGRELAFFLRSPGYVQKIRYLLQAMSPGSYLFPPARLISLANPGTRTLSGNIAFEIAPPGAESPDIRPTPDELYDLGMAAMQEKQPRLAIENLERLSEGFKLTEGASLEVLAKLLFASIEVGDAERIVKYFELAKEKNPALVIPFEKIEPIQAAYRKVEAFEAGLHLGRGVAQARFMSEVRGVGILETEDQMAEALDMLKTQLDTYPDNSQNAEATYAFSQVVFDRADRVREGEALPGFNRPGLLDEVIGLMGRFLGMFPEHPQAPPAVYSLASALLERERPEKAVDWCETGLQRHKDSDLAPAMAYLKAFSHFKLGEYGHSLELCKKVADDSPDNESREMARYIMAQIHHARGNMGAALELYRKVQGRFRDAQETINEAEKTSLHVPEVVEVPRGKRPVLALELKNLTEVTLRAYRVDPMKLYLVKGTLSNLTDVNLAGIKPVVNRTLRFGTKIGMTHKFEQPLRLPGKGAYLLLVRGGSHLAHTLLLIDSLSTEVTEIPYEGRVRVTVRDSRGRPIPGARVQLKGSSEERFIAGKTDLRGIFIAEDITGEVTVITEARGAFGLHRGEIALGGSPAQRQEVQYKKSTVYDFEDELIEGQMMRAPAAQGRANKGFFQQDVKGMSVQQAK